MFEIQISREMCYEHYKIFLSLSMEFNVTNNYLLKVQYFIMFCPLNKGDLHGTIKKSYTLTCMLPSKSGWSIMFYLL